MTFEEFIKTCSEIELLKLLKEAKDLYDYKTFDAVSDEIKRRKLEGGRNG